MIKEKKLILKEQDNECKLCPMVINLSDRFKKLETKIIKIEKENKK